jgi:hypothetical protein
MAEPATQDATSGTVAQSGKHDVAESHVARLAACFGHTHLAAAITGASSVSVITILVLDLLGDRGQWWRFGALALGALLLAGFAWWWNGMYGALTTAQKINYNQYAQIRDRIVELKSALQATPKGNAANGGAGEPQGVDLITDLEKDLSASGGFWASGVAYLEAWERLHRAEEAAVMSAGIAHVRSIAVKYIDRLRGSEIPNAIDLQGRLKAALEAIESAMRHPPVDDTAPAIVIARNDVRYVTNSVNEYRDGQWRALVGFREIVMTTAGLLWITLYGVLLLAVAAGAPRLSVTGGLMFFLAGSVAGFLSQMYSQSRAGTESSVEDFGLALGRIFAMPAFSGAIAVVGVVAVGALHLNVNGVSLSTSSGSGSAVDWQSVFNWQTNGLGYAIAFIASLAPERIFDLLRSSKDIKLAISRTEAAG